MKIQVKKEVIEYVDVELPFYKKSSCHYYKVYSEDKCIQVCNLEESESIKVVTNLCAFISTLDSTKEEFDLEFARISNVLNDLTT